MSCGWLDGRHFARHPRPGELPHDRRPRTRSPAHERPISGVTDQQLDAPTPCEDTSVGALLDHIDSLAQAFTAAAAKAPGHDGPPPKPEASRLEDDWRTRVPQRVIALAEAWKDQSAWSGTTRAGGLELPGEVAGVVALDELVLHGWDLARATSQPYDVDEEALDAVKGFVAQVAAGSEEERQGLFGPAVAVSDDAPHFDRVLGLAGRDPGWSPA